MTIDELLNNIEDRYQLPKDDNGNYSRLMHKDFGFYPPDKLEKVWNAIKRHHKSNFAPNYSSIVDCMDKAGLSESKPDGDSNFYQQCDKCKTKYSMGVACCPKCNKYLKVGTNYMNKVTIVKCHTMPADVIFTRQACPICPIYRASTVYPRGIKCDSFQGEMRGQLPDCDKCKCKPCCLDLGSRNENMDSGTLMGVVKSCVKSARELKDS